MAGPNSKKRDRTDAASRPSKKQRPTKKQRQLQAYHSSSSDEGSDDEGGGSFTAVNVLDSDAENDSDNLDNLDDAVVEDLDAIASDESADESSGSEMDPEEAAAVIRQNKAKATMARDAPVGSDEDSADSDEDEDGEEGAREGKKKSKRNDPTAFATSISKILSTKLSASKQADPVLSRSIDARRSAKEAVDSALEAKARRKMREQKRLASEKGRVRDVLVGATDAKTGEAKEVTGEILQTERKLRKVAHRGVIMLFRAVREAQERAVEAERDAKKDGMTGVQSRQEKVNEMSRQGFLDLIAGSGGKLKKGGLEEA